MPRVEMIMVHFSSRNVSRDTKMDVNCDTNFQFQLFLSALDKCGLRHVRIKITETQGLSILFLQRGAVKRLICLFVCLLFTLMSKWLKLPAKGLVTHNGITIIHICEMLTEPLSSGVSNTCKVKNFINFHQYIFMKSSDYIA